jgi:hypothetical protein
MFKSFALLLGFMSLTNIAQADVLSIANPSYQVPNNESGVKRPTQGMSMTDVEQQFGTPEKKFAAVGEPPITRWQYAEFVVYFEHGTVLHAVVPREK